ncbi:GNAT family N-acetyltransferase [Streptomyces sp. NBC_01023]|uniref:GNAT family N-acetyltransferase n=1 Tax=unclassified Streptomyces TaxID=2593676 RepID=UPI0030DFCC6A|nr:GNAT family N-acetyltransferase [Streptomyces sp. NBC_01023]
MQYRYATEADVPAMAKLFAANRRDALTEQQRSEQGFVQGNFDDAALRAMVRGGSLLVADDAGVAEEPGDAEDPGDAGCVVGLLALSSPEQVPSPPPPVRALLDAQDSLRWQGQPLSASRWLLYGPVVVDAAFRGRGVARGLFDLAVEVARGRADAVVAFIEAENQPSRRVHVDGFGMCPLGDFVAGGRTYSAVAAPARVTPS